MKSSKLNALGYDPETMTLRAEFSTGALYDYYDVPPEKYMGLVAAQSLGTYFGTNIIGSDRKNPNFKFEKVGAPGATQAATRAAAEKKGPEPTIIEAKASAPASLAVSATPEELPEDQEGLKQRAAIVKSESTHLVKLENNRTILIVNSGETYEAVAQLLIRRHAEKKAAQARIASFKAPAYATYQAVLAFEKEVIGGYDAAIADIDRALTSYRQDEQARAREAARLQQEADQKRLDAENEQRAREAQERADAEAANMRAAGQHEVAEQIEKNPEPVARMVAQAPIVKEAVPQVQGLAVRGSWKYVIADAELVPRYFAHQVAGVLAANGFGGDMTKAGMVAQQIARAFAELYTLDETKIGAKVRALKEGAKGLIPGVTVEYAEKTGSSGR